MKAVIGQNWRHTAGEIYPGKSTYLARAERRDRFGQLAVRLKIQRNHGKDSYLDIVAGLDQTLLPIRAMKRPQKAGGSDRTTTPGSGNTEEIIPINRNG